MSLRWERERKRKEEGMQVIASLRPETSGRFNPENAEWLAKGQVFSEWLTLKVWPQETALEEKVVVVQLDEFGDEWEVPLLDFFQSLAPTMHRNRADHGHGPGGKVPENRPDGHGPREGQDRENRLHDAHDRGEAGDAVKGRGEGQGGGLGATSSYLLTPYNQII